MKTIHLISILLSVFVLCSAVLYHQKQQFDYLYLDGAYYMLTSEKICTHSGSVGASFGTIRRNAPISARQQDGDSNVLSVGSAVYAINTSTLPSTDRLHYTGAIAYPENDNFYLARLICTAMI